MLLRTSKNRRDFQGNFQLCRSCMLLGKGLKKRSGACREGRRSARRGRQRSAVSQSQTEKERMVEKGWELFYFSSRDIEVAQESIDLYSGESGEAGEERWCNDNKKRQPFKKRREIKHNEIKWKTQVRRDSQQQGSLGGPGQVDHEGQLTREGYWGREELLGNAGTIEGSLNIKSREGIVGPREDCHDGGKGWKASLSRRKMHAFQLLWGHRKTNLQFPV